MTKQNTSRMDHLRRDARDTKRRLMDALEGRSRCRPWWAGAWDLRVKHAEQKKHDHIFKYEWYYGTIWRRRMKAAQVRQMVVRDNIEARLETFVREEWGVSKKSSSASCSTSLPFAEEKVLVLDGEWADLHLESL